MRLPMVVLAARLRARSGCWARRVVRGPGAGPAGICPAAGAGRRGGHRATAGASLLAAVTLVAPCSWPWRRALVVLRGRCSRGRSVEATRDVGLRLRAPDRPDAVHRLVLRPAADGPVPRLPAHAQAPSQPPAGLFPREASFATETPDVCREMAVPARSSPRVARRWRRLRWLQHGRVQLYVLYIAADAAGPAGLEAGVAAMNWQSASLHSCWRWRWRRCCWASSTGPRPSSPGRRGAAARCRRTTTSGKLLRKGAVYSRTTTWVFRAGPVVGLASARSRRCARAARRRAPAPLAFRRRPHPVGLPAWA